MPAEVRQSLAELARIKAEPREPLASEVSRRLIERGRRLDGPGPTKAAFRPRTAEQAAALVPDRQFAGL
ncbi:hypothetical protein [Streptomyces sp. HD]|uniref:hypothetical protein n=1 Tax=Streptomyces sp. HD TaxID=3020892 RepID=UPI002330F7FB|nr:hypothetical protein [Streptomyces sp. HD]MDC0768535.1 hypothetical protein [Streptomyces sp. HD]